MSEDVPQDGLYPDRSLLIVDDDKVYARRLKVAMEARDFIVTIALTVTDAIASINHSPPSFAVVDIRLEHKHGGGLQVIEALCKVRPGARAIVLTAYSSFYSAVVATRLGAFGYLAKPATAEEIIDALLTTAIPPPPALLLSANRVRWEHIQRIYELCDRNVSETARRLTMHRRTLQRILSKRAPK